VNNSETGEEGEHRKNGSTDAQVQKKSVILKEESPQKRREQNTRKPRPESPPTRTSEFSASPETFLTLEDE